VSDAHSAEEKPEASANPKGPSKLPILLAVVNTVAILAAMGFLVYTKLLFKRPAITETSVRAQLAKTTAIPLLPAEPGFVNFEPTTLNIAAAEDGRRRYATIGFSVGIRDNTRSSEIEAVRPLIMDKVLSLLGRRSYQDLVNVQGRYVLRSELIDAINAILRDNAGQIQAPSAGQTKVAGGANAEAGEGGKGEGAKEEGAEGGEGGEHGAKAKAPAGPHAQIVGDLVSDVFFTQFIVQ
jgi:flagellar FliL protein